MVYETAPMVTKNFNNPTAGVDIWKTADQNPYGFTPGVREGDILYIYKTPDGRVGNIIWLENVKNLPKKAIRGQSTRMYMQWGFAYGFISKVDGGKVTVETLSDGSMGGNRPGKL